MMRDERIDFLRFVGLAMIILAHIYPPMFIFQLRNFDVPLMVLVSASAFSLSYKKNEKYIDYFIKRVKRLVFPTWIFLTFYFLLVGVVLGSAELPSWGEVFGSYFLLDGIGYVWIIRIFLIVALAAPFLDKLNRVIRSDTNYLTFLLLIYISYEILVFIFSIVKPPSDADFLYFLFESIPYLILFSLGLRLQYLKSNFVLALAVGCFLIFISISLFYYNESGTYLTSQKFKYPPKLYYLSYALAISLSLWAFLSKYMNLISEMFFYPVIRFLSKNSLWVYLWHIPLVEYIDCQFYYKYPLVFFFAGAFTLIQVTFVDAFVLPKVQSVSRRKAITVLLTG